MSDNFVYHCVECELYYCVNCDPGEDQCPTCRVGPLCNDCAVEHHAEGHDALVEEP